MKLECYLPDNFEAFCTKLGVKPLPVGFEPDYAGLKLAEKRGDWVVDRSINLAIELTKYEDHFILRAMVDELDMVSVLQDSHNINSFKKNIWFLKSLTEDRIENEPFCKGRWNKIKVRFREFNKARKNGNMLDSKKSKLLNLVKTLEIQFRLDSEKLITKAHNDKLVKRKSIARAFFPHNIVDVFNRAEAERRLKGDESSKARVQIGLGVQSTYIPKKIKRDSVVLDDRTTSKTVHDKHILYTAGWSLTPDEL
jgi:hypothetical protein